MGLRSHLYLEGHDRRVLLPKLLRSRLQLHRRPKRTTIAERCLRSREMLKSCWRQSLKSTSLKRLPSPYLILILSLCGLPTACVAALFHQVGLPWKPVLASSRMWTWVQVLRQKYLLSWQGLQISAGSCSIGVRIRVRKPKCQQHWPPNVTRILRTPPELARSGRDLIRIPRRVQTFGIALLLAALLGATPAWLLSSSLVSLIGFRRHSLLQQQHRPQDPKHKPKMRPRHSQAKQKMMGTLRRPNWPQPRSLPPSIVLKPHWKIADPR
mmetsp:Transcript_22367/g.40267  ORF Transcript_22367/g.40267 Transcript_22367/m.40267 type:complete len:268 (-) Transcript_22367:1572-2375(-)